MALLCNLLTMANVILDYIYSSLSQSDSRHEVEQLPKHLRELDTLIKRYVDLWMRKPCGSKLKKLVNLRKNLIDLAVALSKTQDKKVEINSWFNQGFLSHTDYTAICWKDGGQDVEFDREEFKQHYRYIVGCPL